MSWLIVKFRGATVPEVLGVDNSFNSVRLLSNNPEIEWWQILDNGGYSPNRYASVPWPAVVTPKTIVKYLPAASKYPEVMDAIYAGRKINAIKIYREFTGCGLKEAKDAVDAERV